MEAGNHQVDPLVSEAVQQVRDRFGAHGLRDMIALAQVELSRTEAALAQLSEELPSDDEPA